MNEQLQASLIQLQEVRICPLSDWRSIIQTKYADGCFIYQSFGREESTFGDLTVRPHVSFLADSGNGTAAEWAPPHGPIQVWTECDEHWRGETSFGNPVEPRAHWHFPFVRDEPLAWSQMAVDRECLLQKVVAGELDGLFRSLMTWAQRS